MGEMEVPADALYGASTQRAVLNFPISGQRMPRRFLRALALIKLAAAETNQGLGPARRRQTAQAIAAGAREVADGAPRRPVPDRRLPDGLGDVDQHEHERGHRPPRVGAARRRKVHPNDDVNRCQSSNDVDPDGAPALGAPSRSRRS